MLHEGAVPVVTETPDPRHRDAGRGQIERDVHLGTRGVRGGPRVVDGGRVGDQGEGLAEAHHGAAARGFHCWVLLRRR